VLSHLQTAFWSGGRANLDQKTEGGIVIVEPRWEPRRAHSGRPSRPLQSFSLVHPPQFLPRQNRHLAMDSIPQELIDTIIDNVPESNLPSCSLVAKRWRRKSQRRVLRTILFKSEDKVKRWCTDIPRDSDGISSYVRHVDIEEIYSWVEPALFSRMLGSLSSLTALSILATQIPDELPGHISRGEFGKGITTLDICIPYCTFATLTSTILSLPDLEELCVGDCEAVPEGPLPTYSVTPQRGPLDFLELYGRVDGIGETLARFRFTSSHLSLDVGITDIEQLLLLSSETVVELYLCGAWSLDPQTEQG